MLPIMTSLELEIGPFAVVHLIVSMNYSTQTLWNVETTIQGSHQEPQVDSVYTLSIDIHIFI